jgi:hypothetical protein
MEGNAMFAGWDGPPPIGGTNTGEITLRDLLAWEPRLTLPGARTDLDRDVDWVVTARATPPMLPALRGGELILLPRRVFAEIGLPLPLLLNEVASQPVAGVVIDAPPPPNPPLPVLTIAAITPELESELNRLLTSRRGDLLRASNELERTVATLGAQEAGLAEIVSALAEPVDLPITVTMPTGAILVRSENATVVPPGDHPDPATGWLRFPLSGGRAIWLGPIPPDHQAIARLLGERLRDVLSGAVTRSVANRPRGLARAAQLNRLLLATTRDERERLAVDGIRLGLPATGRFRVGLSHVATPGVPIQGLLDPAGQVLEAETVDDLPAFVLLSGHSLAGRPAHTAVPAGWIALSAEITSPRELPAATRQARYIAALLAGGELTGTVVRFDDDLALGVWRVLYRFWGTPELDHYVAQFLGPLIGEDRHGTLRRTLLAYLASGGSPGETATRLGIHRNTLAYRLRHIRDLLPLDPDLPENRIALHLALLTAALPPAPAGAAMVAPER